MDYILKQTLNMYVDLITHLIFKYLCRINYLLTGMWKIYGMESIVN